ncbi:hypothetical protein ABIA39_006999 [Nocardia sp. GAS34]
MIDLDNEEALALLAGTRLGRIVFTKDALPAVRPVNHIFHDGKIIVRTWTSPQLTDMTHAVRTTVVAYQVDDINPDSHLGWSVVVIGYAQVIEDPASIALYSPLVKPSALSTNDTLVCISPDLVRGVRFAATQVHSRSVTPARPDAASAACGP